MIAWKLTRVDMIPSSLNKKAEKSYLDHEGGRARTEPDSRGSQRIDYFVLATAQLA